VQPYEQAWSRRFDRLDTVLEELVLEELVPEGPGPEESGPEEPQAASSPRPRPAQLGAA